MGSIDVLLTLRAPTCISDQPVSPGQVATTLGYLTGRTIRGAIATQWLRGRRPRDLGGDERDTFERIFRHGALRFLPGWPVEPDSPERQTWIVPATAWTFKRHGGWFSETGTGVVDVLAPLLRDSVDDRNLLDDLEPFPDEFAVREGDSAGMWSLSVRRRLISRSAIRVPGSPPGAPHRGVTAHGQLHEFEALETGEQFRCTIEGPQEVLDDLEEHVLQPDSYLQLGRRRSAGDGVAQVVLTQPTPRTERNVDHLVGVARRFSDRANAPCGTMYLPITLESDTLLRDTYLLPSSSGDPGETLHRYRPGVPPGMTLHTAMQQTRWIGGWDMLRGLPLTPRLAVRQGSVWVYQVPEEHLATAVAWWLDAEREGIGESVDQGYGMVRLLHPLHAEDVETW